MTTNIHILTNDRGPEAFFALESARSVAKVLRAPIVQLPEDGWQGEIEQLGQDTIAFIATHGGFGEDGRLQATLEAKGVSHTHSAAWACAVMTDKHLTKMVYLELGIATPAWSYVGEQFGTVSDANAWIRKPVKGGSKKGISLVTRLKSDEGLLFEVYIPGTLEVSVSVLGHDEPSALPPLVRNRRRDRIGHLTRSRSTISRRVARICQDAALAIHKALGARGVTKTDFVVGFDDSVFAIETDALPALGPRRSTALQIIQSGRSYERFIHMLARDRPI